MAIFSELKIANFPALCVASLSWNEVLHYWDTKLSCSINIILARQKYITRNTNLEVSNNYRISWKIRMHLYSNPALSYAPIFQYAPIFKQLLPPCHLS